MTQLMPRSSFFGPFRHFSCNVRTMSSSDLTEQPETSRRRRKRRSYALLILAAGIFLFGVAAGTLYLLLRPTTLRIAVGPSGSDDQKLVQTLAQIFARDGSPIRLAPGPTGG